jgi:hypothetical protein
MSINYSKPLPKDSGNSEVMQDYPAARTALRRITSENAAVSSVITLNDNTTMMEVTALGASAVLRWVPTTDTQASVISAAGATANYDHVIPAGTLRRFVVPQETAGITSIAGANIMNGCYQRVAYKSTGIGSVMSTEY